MAKGRADPEDVIVERTNGEVVVSVEVFEGGIESVPRSQGAPS